MSTLRARLTVGVALVIGTGSSVFVPLAEHASATTAYAELAAYDSIAIDASSDGRFVLFVSGSIMDRTNGNTASLGSLLGIPGFTVPLTAARLTGDGSAALFVTTAAIRVFDTDKSEADLYRVSLTTGEPTMMTETSAMASAGLADWQPDRQLEVSADGSRAVFIATSGAATTAVVIEGANIREIGTALGDPGEGQALTTRVWGMSLDGRHVLYSSNRGADGPRLWREDLVTGRRVHVEPPETVLPPGAGLISSAALSGDGSHVAFATPSGQVFLAPIGGVPVQIGWADWPESSPGDARLSISRDASVVTWTQNQVTELPSGTGFVLQVMRWTSPGPARLGSGEEGRAPNGETARGFITDDGGTLYVTTRANNLDRARVSGDFRLRVIARLDDGSPDQSPFTPLSGRPSTYTSRTPVRILDSRIGLGVAAGLPGVRTTISLPIRGANGVPADASAVAVQIAAAEGDGTGFVSLVPSGAMPGRTANLNIDSPGKVIANMAIVPIGGNGAIDVYVQARTHVIVDLLGWWTPVAGAASAGRYVPVGPRRVLDTRWRTAVNSDGTIRPARSITTVQVTGRNGVPETGVRAVVLNVASDESDGVGFVQVAPAEALVPGASSTLNVNRRGQAVSVATIVPVDAQGQVAVYAQPATHLIIDVAGYFTDDTAPLSTAGMFVPWSSPTRMLDTRPTSAVGYRGAKPIRLTRLDLPTNGSALVGNVAATESDGPGYVQLGPTNTMANGTTANVNFTGGGDTVSNAFIAPVDVGLGIFAYTGAHIVIDIAGWMTG